MSERLKSVPLSQLAEVNPSVPIGNAAPTTRVSFIPMTDVSDAGNWEHKQTRELRQVQSGYTRFSEGDVLFAKITPCMENGKGAHALGLVSGVGFGSTEFHVLRALPGVDSRFLFFWTQAAELRKAAEAKMTGSAGQRRVPADFFHRFRVPVLPLPEQRRIAEVLDTADEAIRQTEALIAKLKQMKQGLLHDLLTRGLDEYGDLRDPVAHPEQFKDSPLGRIPRGWEVVPLGRVVPRAEYGISVSLEDAEGVPVLRMNNLRDGEMELSELKSSVSQDAKNLLLKPRDVLFNRTNSIEHVGRTSIWRGQLEEASFASYLVRLVCDETQLIPEYLTRWMNHPATQLRIRQYATPGVQQVNINPTNLRRTEIVLPHTTEEQWEIVRELDEHDARIRAEEVYRNKLQLLKKGLMQDLLTGRVRVPVPEEEPELLEVGG
jgi:type I restriction enzyme, S subunit